MFRINFTCGGKSEFELNTHYSVNVFQNYLYVVSSVILGDIRKKKEEPLFAQNFKVANKIFICAEKRLNCKEYLFNGTGNWEWCLSFMTLNIAENNLCIIWAPFFVFVLQSCPAAFPAVVQLTFIIKWNKLMYRLKYLKKKTGKYKTFTDVNAKSTRISFCGQTTRCIPK